MQQRALNAVVIGAGYIGQMHARMYAENPTATLVGIIDIDEETAESVANEFKTNWWATDAQRALDEHDVDIASIATPEAYHRGPATTALNHDCTVLLEKPIAETVDDALAIGEAVEQSAGESMIGYLLRFHPEYAALKNRIDDGDLGSVLSMHAERIRDRGMYARAASWTNTVYYLSVHDVDMMRWYTGAEVTEAYARGTQPLEEYDTPAVVSASLEFDDGSVGTLESNWARSPEHPAYRSDQFRITGTEGFAEKRERANVQVTTGDGFGYEQPVEMHGQAVSALRHQVDHALQSVHTGETPMITWEDGLRSLVVGNAILKSLDAGRPVPVEYPNL